MEGITGILVFMGIGSILGLIVGNLLWHKDHKRIKLQEEIIEYFERQLDETWGLYHNLVMQQTDDAMQELKKAAEEWEAEKDAAGEPKTLSKNQTVKESKKGD